MFAMRDCVFMSLNCVASMVTYFGFMVVDSQTLCAACPDLENALLIVLILRIYTLPVLCLLKMGIHACDTFCYHADALCLMAFVGVQLHYGILQAYTHPTCRALLLAPHTQILPAAVVLATLLDLSRIAYHIWRCCVSTANGGGIRLDETDARKAENASLIPTTNNTSLDDLLAELDDDFVKTRV